MTPAILILRQQGIDHTVHEYVHDPASDSYGSEAAVRLGVPQEKVFKTLVVALDNGGLAVAVVPVSSMLSMKLMARALGGKKVVMAAPSAVERSTGYVLGGVSPVGQKRQLPTILDSSAADQTRIYISAGRRGLEIELAPKDLIDVVGGECFRICR